MIWIFGKGMLGKELYEQTRKSERARLIGRNDVDISNLNGLNFYIKNKVMEEGEPDIIINCAAMTDVDGCETNQVKCMYSNAVGAVNLAYMSKQLKASFVQVSTDFVFDGEKGGPYYEMEKPNPISFYGKVKYVAEELIKERINDYLIVRTSTVFSKEKGFVRNIIRGIENENIKSISMYPFVRNPTPVQLLAENILNQLRLDIRGIVHIVGKERVKMDDFARTIVDIYDSEHENETESMSITTSEIYPQHDRAKRPVDSSLVVSEFVNQNLELRDYIKEILFDLEVDKLDN